MVNSGFTPEVRTSAISPGDDPDPPAFPVLRPPAAESQWQIAWRRLRRDRAAMAGAGILVIVLLLTLLAPLISPFDPLIQSEDPADRLSPPSLTHPMGTDELRRDIFSRVLHGGRTTIQAGFLSVFGAALIGSSLGLISGYFGGRIDEIVSRLIDVVLTLPGVLLAIVIIAILGPGLQNAMIAVALANIPTFTRLVRGVALTEKNQEYILAVRALGGSPWYIMRRHMLRNVLAPVIVVGTLTVASAIQVAAGLSFLGLGAQPPQPEWGAMLSNGRNYMRSGEWWMTVFPGVAIFIVVLAINLFGDGLRDALDPRLQPEAPR